MQPAELTKSIRSWVVREGFDLVGIAPAAEPVGFSRFKSWLENGYHGEMSYLTDRQDAYRHPDSVLEGVRSVVMLTLNYNTASPVKGNVSTGRIARYAWGNADYHDLIHKKLKSIKQDCKQLYPDVQLRGVVDTAPLLEREFAQMSGLGWFGKNTMLISKRRGSYFFLAAILVDQELVYDQPHVTDHCGTCTACLDACPTQAFPEPGVLDATKCISYLTIEHRTQIPRELRAGMGNWILGCDVCQEVCPWNRHSICSSEPDFLPLADQNPLELSELFSMTDDEFRARFRKSPLWRPKRRGILRNAAIALGNNIRNAGDAVGQREIVQGILDSLCHGLHDSEELVRGAVAWALGQFVNSAVSSEWKRKINENLLSRLAVENDPEVIDEIRIAIGSVAN